MDLVLFIKPLRPLDLLQRHSFLVTPTYNRKDTAGYVHFDYNQHNQQILY